MTIGDRIKQRRKAVFWKRIIKTIEATNDTKKNPKVIFYSLVSLYFAIG